MRCTGAPARQRGRQNTCQGTGWTGLKLSPPSWCHPVCSAAGMGAPGGLTSSDSPAATLSLGKQSCYTCADRRLCSSIRGAGLGEPSTEFYIYLYLIITYKTWDQLTSPRRESTLWCTQLFPEFRRDEGHCQALTRKMPVPLPMNGAQPSSSRKQHILFVLVSARQESAGVNFHTTQLLGKRY